MAAKSSLLGSSLAKKYWMALTGLFLCLFLVVHLAGNLALIWGTPEDFNIYTQFMSSFIPIKVVSYLLYFSILFHAFDGLIMLTKENRSARPVQYAYSKPEKNSAWTSRQMGVLGTAILVFIVIHMGNFWFKYKFTELPLDAAGLPDMHGVVVSSFEAWWYVAIYVLSMAALGFHLWHGFESAFQTMGVSHPKYSPIIKSFGRIFSVVMAIAFAAIPVYIFLT